MAWKVERTRRLRIEFRNFAILGPDSEKAARAVAAAAEQDKAWQFVDSTHAIEAAHADAQRVGIRRRGRS